MRSYYINYRNTFTKILRATKINFYKNKLNSVSSNPKLMWNLIKEITNTVKNSTKVIKSIKINNKIVDASTEPKKVANLFNDFFVDIGITLSKNIIQQNNNQKENIYNDMTFDDIFSKDISEKDICDIINNLKDDTAAGHDKVNVKLLKSICTSIVHPLMYIFNLSIKNCVFPETFKKAIVIPLYKNGSQNELNNYRPISMLCNFSKILEKIIKTRLITYLEKNKLLSNNQFGFRPGLSSEDALYNVTKYISNALDNKKKALAIFLDLTKAFDTVNHDKLINILPSFGIKSNSLKWIMSYLKNRTQIVNINGTLGDKKKITCGVPQGSVLGPIFFILYINNICNMTIDGKIITYADDTCLLFSDYSWDLVLDKAINDTKKVINYLNKRNLSLNIKKTFFMTFTINNTHVPIDDLTVHICRNQNECNDINCKKIFRVQRFRYLGIIFDEHLRWNLHISNLVMRLRTAVHHFLSLKSILPVEIIRTAYLSLYQAIFQYGIIIWGGLTENNLKPLKLQQNKIIRICLNKHSLDGSTKTNYLELRVLPVKLVHAKFTILWVKKNIINTWFSADKLENKRECRAYNITVNYVNTTFGQRFLDYLGPVCYNKMDLETKKNVCSKSYDTAKQYIKKWLFCNLDNNYYD